MKYKKYPSFLVLLGTLALSSLMACSAEVNDSSVKVDDAVQKVLAEGLSCEAQNMIYGMNRENSQEVRRALQGQLGAEDLAKVINDRERCDAESLSIAPDESAQGGTISQAITGTYTVVFIPEQSSVSVGWSPISINRDGSAYGNMCGSSYEFPKDYIAEFDNVTNAYSSPSGLRIMGLNTDGSCYIDGNIASRVYSDNDIRSCFGYWTVWGCGGTFDTGDVRIYRN